MKPINQLQNDNIHTIKQVNRKMSTNRSNIMSQATRIMRKNTQSKNSHDFNSRESRDGNSTVITNFIQESTKCRSQQRNYVKKGVKTHGAEPIKNDRVLLNDYVSSKPKSFIMSPLYNSVRMQKYKAKTHISKNDSGTPNVQVGYKPIGLTSLSLYQNKENCSTMKKHQQQLFVKKLTKAHKHNQSMCAIVPIMSLKPSSKGKLRTHHQLKESDISGEIDLGSDRNYEDLEVAPNRKHFLRQSLSSFIDNDINEDVSEGVRRVDLSMSLNQKSPIASKGKAELKHELPKQSDTFGSIESSA